MPEQDARQSTILGQTRAAGSDSIPDALRRGNTRWIAIQPVVDPRCAI